MEKEELILNIRVADIKDNTLVSVDHSPIVVVVPSNAPIGRPVIILYRY